MMDKATSVAKASKDRLGCIERLTRDLPESAVKQLTINAMIRHRQLVAEAEALEGDEPRGWDVSTPDEFLYVEAMINMLAQMDVLSILLDRLGYIPDVPGEQVN